MEWFWLVLIGAAGGVASGLLGVGGGTVFIPLLVYILGYDLHVAVGTSLAVIIPTAVSGVVRHGTAGKVEWAAAAVIAVFAILGAWFGAGLSLKMNTLLLRRVFALFLVFVAVRMFFKN